jgi:hypothetical protein
MLPFLPYRTSPATTSSRLQANFSPRVSPASCTRLPVTTPRRRRGCTRTRRRGIARVVERGLGERRRNGEKVDKKSRECLFGVVVAFSSLLYRTRIVHRSYLPARLAGRERVLSGKNGTEKETALEAANKALCLSSYSPDSPPFSTRRRTRKKQKTAPRKAFCCSCLA